MTTIGRADVLRGIARVLNLAGTRTAPSEVDVGRPVPPLLDVGPFAVAGSIITVVREDSETTAGTGTASYLNWDAAAVLSQAASAGLTTRNTDVYLTDIAAFVTDASAANAGLVGAAIYPPKDPSYVGGASTELYAHMLSQWNTAAGSPLLEAAGSYVPMYLSASDTYSRQAPPFGARLPRRLGTVAMSFNDGGAGAAAYSIRSTYQLVPKGTLPPPPF